MPPAVDTNPNARRRASRPNFRIELKPAKFVAAVMQALEAEVFEIRYGMSAGLLAASRGELDRRFEYMNSQ